MATERGRVARPNLKVGICGEHGGEPSSVKFFAHAGLDYVYCSPFSSELSKSFHRMSFQLSLSQPVNSLPISSEDNKDGTMLTVGTTS